MNKQIIVLLVLMPCLAMAQTKKTNVLSRTSKEIGAVISSNGSMTALALHAEQYWGFGKKKKKFKVGLGVRLTSSIGSSSLEYITAPSKITSGKTGPGVLFASNIMNNIDTLTLGSTQINALNLFVLLNYNIYKNWSVEFNIDALGFSLGGKQDAVLSYGDGSIALHKSLAKPTTVNALLISDNDLGSLNSELKVIYSYNKRVKLNAGAAFLFNEYTLNVPIKYVSSLGTTLNVDRYRNKALMFGIGINYKL